MGEGAVFSKEDEMTYASEERQRQIAAAALQSAIDNLSVGDEYLHQLAQVAANMLLGYIRAGSRSEGALSLAQALQSLEGTMYKAAHPAAEPVSLGIDQPQLI